MGKPIVTDQHVCSRGGIVKNAGPDPQQQLPFFTQPTNSQVSNRHRPVKPCSKRYLQDILWKESLLAVQVSMDCQTTAELVARLPERLPQNSAVTRQRNTSTIVSRFFPVEEIDQLPRQILRLYEDEDLLAAMMRVLFLEAEPLVGQLVAERLARLPAGTALPKDFFVQYTLEALGKRATRVLSLLYSSPCPRLDHCRQEDILCGSAEPQRNGSSTHLALPLCTNPSGDRSKGHASRANMEVSWLQR
jgi:hypothetical protein